MEQQRRKLRHAIMTVSTLVAVGILEFGGRSCWSGFAVVRGATFALTAQPWAASPFKEAKPLKPLKHPGDVAPH